MLLQIRHTDCVIELKLVTSGRYVIYVVCVATANCSGSISSKSTDYLSE